jgi:hypothetical protein
MAKRKPKGRVVVAKAVRRKKAYIYFLDAQGNVREAKRKNAKKPPTKKKRAKRCR